MKPNTSEWYLQQYHHNFGHFVYDGSQKSSPIEDNPTSTPSFEPALISRLYCDEMLRVVTRRQRVFILMKMEGYTKPDIAELTDCKTETVNQEIMKAKKRLRGTSLVRGRI